MERTFHVYFMASKSGVLYLGVTNNLPLRLGQHKEKILPGFTKKYNVTKLVWFEPHTSIRSAISREKEIKKWRVAHPCGWRLPRPGRGKGGVFLLSLF